MVKWIAYAPQLVLMIVLVLEVFNILFQPFNTLPSNTLTHFAEAILATVAAGIVFAVRWPGAQPTAWMTFARAMDQSVSLVLFAIFGIIALFATYFGIPWRHRVYGIVIGFLFDLAIDTAVTTAVAQYSLSKRSVVWPIHMLAFLFTCGIWAYYFALPEMPRAVPKTEELNRILAVLKQNARWMRSINPNEIDSL